MINFTGNVVKAQSLNAAPALMSGVSALENASKIRSFVTFCHPNALDKGRTPKHFRISATQKLKLDPYQILKYPLFTESTTRDIEGKNALAFIVDVRADKSEIKAAVQETYGIKVKKVNTLISPDGKKKAFVQLTPDQTAADVLNRTLLT